MNFSKSMNTVHEKIQINGRLNVLLRNRPTIYADRLLTLSFPNAYYKFNLSLNIFNAFVW